MTSATLSRFRNLAVATAVTTLVLTGLGGLVRGTGSGLGCADEWPRCLGGWVAPVSYHALIEYSHRVVAGIVVLLIVGLVIGARRWVPGDRLAFRLSLLAFAVVLVQAWLGRVVVVTELHAALVTAHFTAALVLVGVTTTIASRAVVAGRPRADADEDRTVARLSFGAAAALVPLLLVGAYVREKGAGLAFGDWPLMGGSLIPSFGSSIEVIHFTHRLLALLVVGHLVVVALRARRDVRGGVRVLGVGGLMLYLAQVLVGAANVWTTLHPATVVAHASLAYVTFAAYVALAVVSRYGRVRVGTHGPEHTHGPARGVWGVQGPEGPERPQSERQPSRTDPQEVPGRSAFFTSVGAYVRLTKPRIISLLLITTVPAMVLAERGLPPLWLIAATILGGMLTAGSANAFNQYLERDIDGKMQRTRSRPLPAHSVRPERALIFAIAIGIAGFVWLWLIVNLLSAALAVGAIAFYVVVYTILLKRNTPQNIVIGGAAGAAPVLIGWAAVTGTVGPAAWVMFAIVFFWTPPHFWALAMRYRDDYAAAGVPMLPVVRGDASTTFQILVYSIVLVATTLALSPVGGLGALYAFTAVGLGAWFLWRAVQLRLEPTGPIAFRLFRYSITYLAVLFVAIAADPLVW